MKYSLLFSLFCRTREEISEQPGFNVSLTSIVHLFFSVSVYLFFQWVWNIEHFQVIILCKIYAIRNDFAFAVTMTNHLFIIPTIFISAHIQQINIYNSTLVSIRSVHIFHCRLNENINQKKTEIMEMKYSASRTKWK